MAVVVEDSSRRFEINYNYICIYKLLFNLLYILIPVPVIFIYIYYYIIIYYTCTLEDPIKKLFILSFTYYMYTEPWAP